jgi:EpsI family protein
VNKLPWRGLVYAIVMALGYLLAEHLTPKQYLADVLPQIQLEKSFPDAFDEWYLDPASNAQVVNPQTEEFVKSVYSQSFSRTYLNAKGERVMLSIAYRRNQADGQAVHFPEVCYPAQGFKIVSSQRGMLKAEKIGIPVTRLVTKLQERNEPVTYWVLVGDRLVESSFGGKIAQVKYGLTGTIPDGLLFRVSTIDTNQSHAWKVHEKFAGDLLKAVTPELASRLAGKNYSK